MAKKGMMNYRRFQTAAHRSKKSREALKGGINFLDEAFVSQKYALPIHPIFPKNEYAYIPVKTHETEDGVVYYCSHRDDCIGCNEGHEEKEKYGITVIRCDYFHSVEEKTYGGSVIEKTLRCEGDPKCEHCRAGETPFFGRKQILVLPTSQYGALLNMFFDRMRICRGCGNSLRPELLLCPDCGNTLASVGDKHGYDEMEELFRSEMHCNECDEMVTPEQMDVCVSVTGRVVDCSVTAPHNANNLILSVKKTQDHFPTIECKHHVFDDFWDKTEGLDNSPLPDEAFIPDWPPEMQKRFFEMRRKSRMKWSKKNRK